MTPREIIAEAWAIARREKALKRWGFLSSFLETLLNVKLLGYQVYFIHAAIVGHEVGLLDDFYWLHARVPLWAFITIVALFGLLLLVEFLMPHLAKGAIIGLTAKSHRGEKVEGGLVLALYNFFPIFTIHEFLVLSGWATVVTAISMTLRYIESDVKYTMIAFILLVFCVSNILKFFFSFAEPAVVVKKLGIFEAMGQSFKMIISYLGQIMFLMLLLIIISIRVIINTAVVVVLPFIIIGLGFLLATFLSPLLSYIIAGVVGVGLIVAASFLFAYLHVFNEAVWTITYIELKKHKDLDAIE